MERVMQAVNRHLDDCDYKTEELAQDVGVSRVHLHRKLKALTGVSPGEFVRNLRLKQAARLLLEQQGDITQVAYACGFSSSSVFSTAFKKCYGVSPRTYIEQNGTPQEPHEQQ
jgi:AraC-like DNA-binding protein